MCQLVPARTRAQRSACLFWVLPFCLLGNVKRLVPYCSDCFPLPLSSNNYRHLSLLFACFIKTILSFSLPLSSNCLGRGWHSLARVRFNESENERIVNHTCVQCRRSVFHKNTHTHAYKSRVAQPKCAQLDTGRGPESVLVLHRLACLSFINVPTFSFYWYLSSQCEIAYVRAQAIMRQCDKNAPRAKIRPRWTSTLDTSVVIKNISNINH